MIKARVLWIEDFDGKEDIELKQRFIKHSGLDDCEIDWAYDFDDFLSKINREDMIYDTIIIDVNVPAESDDYKKVKEYIDESKFQEYINYATLSEGREKAVNRTGCIIALYLLRSKLFEQNRICFYSANIYENRGDYSLNEIIYGIESGFMQENDICHWYNSVYTRVKNSLANTNIGKEKLSPSERRQLRNKIASIKSWNELRENSERYPDTLRAYLISEEFDKQYKLIKPGDPKLSVIFSDFKKAFESTGMKFFSFFEKAGNDNMRPDFHRFMHNNNHEYDYYQFRFAVINMCNILREWLKDKNEMNDVINLHIFKSPKQESDRDKYIIVDFRAMLSNIISYLKGFKPNNEEDEKRIYKDIVMTITLFAENIDYTDYKADVIKKDFGFFYPLQRAIKVLRNGIQHNSTSFDSDLDMSFCAFVVGIGLRLYFNISCESFKEFSPDYLKMERILIGFISKSQELPDENLIRAIVNADNDSRNSCKCIPAYTKLTKYPKSKKDIYKLYILCSYYEEVEIDKLDTPQNQQQICNTKFNPITGYTENSIEIEYLKRIAGLI